MTLNSITSISDFSTYENKLTMLLFSKKNLQKCFHIWQSPQFRITIAENRLHEIDTKSNKSEINI